MLIKYYIRRVLATGYGAIKFIKFLRESRAPRACISNIKSKNKRREHCYRKPKKRRRKEERLSFQKPENREDLVRCSVR